MSQASSFAGLSRRERALLFERLRERKERSEVQPDRIERRAPGTEPLPLSFAQQRLWFLDRLEPGSPAYNIPIAVRLLGALDPRAFQEALNAVISRHESLRTKFVLRKEGVPVQVIAPELRMPLPFVDLSAGGEGAAGEVQRICVEESQQPFDLSRGPLLRALLLRLGGEEHVLVATMHHIVSDGWSMGVLVQEVSACYGAFVTGVAVPLPELPVQYPDFALWQREWLSGDLLEKQLAYWRGQLQGLPDALSLPSDRPRPPRRSYAGAARPFGLEEPLAQGLRGLARECGGTLFIALLAGLQALLQRLTGEEDLAVGTPVANRNRAETSDLIGFFVNTLVLRGDLSGDPSFRELLGRLRKVALAAYEHQDLPFERLVEELRPERDPSRTPLFQILFVLQNTPSRTPGLGGLRLEGVPLDPGIAQFDLALTLQEMPDGEIGGSLAFSTELFDPATAARFTEHLRLLLAGAVADPDRRLSELPLLSGVEIHQTLLEWADTRAALPEELCLHELVTAQAERTPDSVAVEWEGGNCTYRELASRTGLLARHLRGLGVGPERIVGLCAERSLDMVVGLLGILQAGGAYLPLDPSYPRERLAGMVEDSGAAILLVHESTLDILPEGTGRLVRLDGDWGGSDGAAAAITPDHLACVLYTSGSTGRPKGVMVPHRGLVNRLLWAQEVYSLGPEDAVLQKAPLAFDFSVWECFAPLIAGARLVLARPGGHRDSAYLARVIAERGVTLAHFVPSMLRVWLEEPGIEGLSSLRQVFSGGEALAPELRDRFAARLKVPLDNQYGPTEISIDTTRWTCEPDSPRVPIGRPIANTRVHLVDPALRPVPIGVPGELLVGGAGVVRGYLGLPGLTAERFVPDPFAEEPGSRLYRTGDLARWLPDGTLDFLGRIDHQVKIRGVRVEPGEIEAVLSALPGVREAVVLTREDSSGGPRLIAYAIGDSLSTAELREQLRSRLPEPMVPSDWVLLHAFPLTPSGKLDRRALAALSPEGDREEAFVLPRDLAEEVMASLWAEVLRVERVGVRDHFFDRGGHSLLATQLVSRIREAFGVDLPLHDFFEHPTLEALTAHVEAYRGSAPRPRAAAIRPAPRDRSLPLSFAQERLWFLDRLEPGGAAYNMPLALEARGDLSPAALEAALGGLVRRHESLRTTFATGEDGAPFQEIAPAGSWHLAQVDLAGLPPAARIALDIEVRRLASEEAQRPFDLARGPLLRSALLRLAPSEHVLLFNVHHIVSDGWSMGVLVREVTTLYRAAAQGEPSPLPRLPVQYADFAVWQREWLRDEALDRQMAFWRERLAGAPASLDLPTDRPRPPVQSFRGATVHTEFGPELTRDLRALGRSRGATLFMVLFAATVALLRRLTGQEDLVIGTPIAGRNHLATEGLIGFFVNSLALRLDAAGDPSFSDLLARVRGAALDAYAHQDLPFERLVEELRPERHLSHNPLFQVMFALQNAPAEPVELPGLKLAPLDFDWPTAKFDLGITFHETADGMAAAFEYPTDLFDPATLRRWAAHLGELLEGAAADSGRRISEIPLLTEEERHHLLAEWNDSEASESAGDVVARFEAQAALSPEAPALVFGEEALTYRELNRRANRLAHRLRAGGVGPGAAVGLCAERSIEMVVGLLGIWKAGGAFVPLDPGHPRARLSFLLEDSEVPALVTQRRLVEAIPAHSARTFLLEDEEGAEADPEPLGTPADLAYMIYTSGTTGQPKAVLVERRSLAATLEAVRSFFAAGDRMPCVAPFSFDIFLFELLGPLLCGGTSILFPLKPALDVERLTASLGGATLLHAVPALMRQIVQTARRSGVAASLRGLFVGGDTVPGELLADLRATFPQVWVRVLYGPTEGTILCSAHEVPRDGEPRPLLGRPLAGATLDLRDRDGRLVPVGVPGEIWIGGSGVTRGYWRRGELTAEKYVLCPDRPGERCFRTGDLARRLQDGTLEFLGRIDQQVKVRGFRIEVGEIESALARHPEVREAVVVARGDDPAGKRLVAYVVRRPAEADGEAPAEHVAQWQTLYEEVYARESSPADPTFNVEGWNSSYTGEPIPAAEMREWVNRTVERISALGHRRVLEVGCGTGLLLYRLAPGTECYHGTDFSLVAIDSIRRQLGRPGLDLPQASLAQRAADDWSGIEPGAFDLVILNSVAQYFPGIDYLLRVLEGAVRTLTPGGGAVFVGDVRSLPLLPALHTSVELTQASPSLLVTELRRRVRRRVADEEELVVAPEFFLALARRLPAIRQVELLVKRGSSHNELIRFRYDVVLRVGGESGNPPSWSGWRGLPELQRVLTEERPDGIALAGIPNARLAAEAEALDLLTGTGQELETVAELRQEIADRAGRTDWVDPEDLAILAERHGYRVALTFDPEGRAECFAAALSRTGSVALDHPLPEEPLPWSEYANDPLRGKEARRFVPALRRLLQAELPEYMVPSAFVLLDALPLTAHGKVDRAALPSPEASRSGASGEFTAPRNPTEEALAGFWAEILGLDAVGVADDFFELGGHSLLATQVVSRIRSAFGVELPLRGFFEGPTVEELAARVEELRRTPSASRIPPLEPAAIPGPLPLSYAQERLWFLQQLEPGSTSYNMPVALELRGALQVGALAAALSEIARRHQVLRTTFDVVGGIPWQRIGPVPEVPLTVVDLRALPAEARGAEAGRLAERQARTPFDLERGPLLVNLLLRIEEEGYVAISVMHHIVSDGWSMGVFVREFAALYAAFAKGRPSPLPELPLQYADFAVWQRRWLQGEALAEEIGWWRERLAGAPVVLELPADRPRPPVQSLRGRRLPVSFGTPLAAALRTLARRREATMFMVLLTGFQALVARYTGQDDLLVGSPVANRNRSEVEDLIGFFVNNLVLRARTGDDPSFAKMLDRVRDSTREAYEHQDLPFEKLVEALQPERSLARTPLFQVSFALQNAPAGALELPGVSLAPVSVPIEESKFDLAASLQETPEGLGGWIEYATDLFDEATMDRFAGHLANLLAGAAADPEARLSDLPLLDEAETSQIRAWCGSGERFRILDRRLHLAPIGVPGELCLVEDGPAEEDAAAEWLVPDPLAEEPGARLLRTGERARLRPDGTLELLDRAATAAPAPASPALEPPPQATEETEIQTSGGITGMSLQELATAAGLSPDDQDLLEMLLREEGVTLEEERGIRRLGAGEAPLSFSQERLWFLDQLTPGTGTYNMPGAMRLRGALDIRVLERCFAELFRRHESLRTRFLSRGGKPVQVIDPPAALALPRIDLTALPAAARRPEAERVLAQDAGAPFDLERGPLFRPALVRLGELDGHGDESVLLMTLHHIVTDGWSMGVLYRELTQLYEAFAAGRASPLPELPVQYADFAVWQRERLSGPDLEAQLGYWRERLAGHPGTLDLPLDRPRPAVQTYRGVSLVTEFPPAVAEPLLALSRAEGASPFMTLLAGFTLLLHRLSGQEDLLVGTPIAGRSRPELEGLIGFFLNTLVLRTDLSGRPSFRELILRVREAALGAYAHQDIPFERLLEDLQPERDLSRTPLFQVFFNMLNLPRSGAQLPGGVEIEPLGSGEGDSKFDLTVYAVEGEGRIGLNLVYNADLFDRERMEEMLRQYGHLLAQVGRSPDAPIEQVSLLTAEAAALLPDPMAPLGDEWRGAVHELFVERARRHPERPAVVDDEGTWTYGDLDAASRRLAARLRADGVRPGDRVAIYAHRSAPVAWAVLGTLRAGAAFVLLDPAYPPARLIEMLRLAEPRAWLALEAAGEPAPELADFVAGHESLAVRLTLPGGGPERALPSLGESAEVPVEIGPDDLAYIAFTSGSTGKPKGILGRHGPLAHFLPWQSERFGLGEEDRYSLLSGLAHDPLQRDLFTPLCLGGILCVPSFEEVAASGRLAGWMARQGVTVAHLTPAMGQILTELPSGSEAPSIPSLRWVLLVGDVLTRLDVDRIRAIAPNVTCVNLYGSTETQRAVGYHVARPVEEGRSDRARQILPLGRGMKDVQLLVVRGALREGAEAGLAGIGEVGEICVRSPHLAAGYLSDEGLTRDRFQVNPFTGREGDRIYRTGDLGRYLPNGEVAFAGRADQQVKIRGFRIELGEIEAVLGRLPGVREAVVLARQDDPDPGSRRLVAYVVAEGEGKVSALRDALRAQLPAYMVPSVFMPLDKLPVTPNGKVDRGALPRPDGERPDLEKPYIEPRTETEAALAEAWASVLGLDRVGVHDDFFELGGHSLLATQVVSRVRDRFGVELPLPSLFQETTLEQLAARIDREREERAVAPGAPLPKLQPSRRRGRSAAQVQSRVEQLSDEEVQELLRRKRGEAPETPEV
jgi:amino acid adenylation domain-containing protein